MYFVRSAVLSRRTATEEGRENIREYERRIEAGNPPFFLFPFLLGVLRQINRYKFSATCRFYDINKTYFTAILIIFPANYRYRRPRTSYALDGVNSFENVTRRLLLRRAV